MGAATLENSIKDPQKLKVELLYDSAIPLLGIYPETMKSLVDICSPMSTAAFLTIAKTWKQPACPQTAEWVILP